MFTKRWTLTHSCLWMTEPFQDAPSTPIRIRSPGNSEPVYLQNVPNRWFWRIHFLIAPVSTCLKHVPDIKFEISRYSQRSKIKYLVFVQFLVECLSKKRQIITFCFCFFSQRPNFFGITVLTLSSIEVWRRVRVPVRVRVCVWDHISSQCFRD